MMTAADIILCGCACGHLSAVMRLVCLAGGSKCKGAKKADDDQQAAQLPADGLNAEDSDHMPVKGRAGSRKRTKQQTSEQAPAGRLKKARAAAKATPAKPAAEISDQQQDRDVHKAKSDGDAAASLSGSDSEPKQAGKKGAKKAGKGTEQKQPERPRRAVQSRAQGKAGSAEVQEVNAAGPSVLLHAS